MTSQTIIVRKCHMMMTCTWASQTCKLGAELLVAVLQALQLDLHPLGLQHRSHDCMAMIRMSQKKRWFSMCNRSRIDPVRKLAFCAGQRGEASQLQRRAAGRCSRHPGVGNDAKQPAPCLAA